MTDITKLHPQARVAVVRWPEEGELRAALRARRLPRLLLVRKGATPPIEPDVLEDWASSTAEASEVEARLATLEARAAMTVRQLPVIGHDGVLRFGDRWIALGPVEATIARVLVERIGELVRREEIEAVAWAGRPVRSNTTDRQLHRLRSHLGELGLEIRTVRGRGYLLERPT